ncbi:MAG: DUF1553 domain-containing protein [Planctomycetia bacterium]|nr:DUF1553 domain-containing protein [Planctomycetia bacterium]
MPLTYDRSSSVWLILVAVAWLAMTPPAVSLEPLPGIGTGELKSLSTSPEKAVLRGADQVQQVLVTGHYANGGVRDLTAQAQFASADPRVVRVEQRGLLAAVGNGTTEVTAEVQGQRTRLRVTVAGTDREQPINFANEIVPIFSKLGCNAGACHGKASGQNGFKLSLLGFEPDSDYVALIREARGRRMFPAAPASSLLLLKATGGIAHGGGKRLDPNGRDYQLILRWIGSGAPFGHASDSQVVRISVTPVHRLLAPRSTQQLAVTAHYSDGSMRDVTRQSEYSSNEPELVAVSEAGLVETHDRPGGGAIMVRHLGQVTVFRATVPQNVPADKFRAPAPANFIDELVFARLKQLNVPPSVLCSDSEFLRRASIDITGTLPTVAEAEKFLADTDPQKRAKLVDELLARPAYASTFALKWGDILRNRRNGLVGVGGAQVRTTALHGWIHDSLEKNKPYDQFVREILTAKGDFSGADAQPPVGWYNVLRTPQALVDDTAQAFLGTRIQCAQCHHHPYEKWSQDDYWGLAAFFARVQLVNPNAKAPLKGPAKADKSATRVVLAGEGEVTSPHGKNYVKPRLLDGAELTVPVEEDPRQKLVDWMVQPDNPFFARALANRYWAHFFGRGIVEMPDDMRVTNPPSNPELLDALAKGFVAQKFDLKQLIRTICTSKTYQLASIPNEYNAKDQQNFARYYPKRLPAEVLSDAIDQVTAVPSSFGQAKSGPARAIDLPDEAVKTPLLAAFGKPERGSACECERSGAATLTQSLYLIGSADVHNKLKNPKSRAGLLAADSRPVAEKIKELYLWVYARPPSAEELKIAEAFLAKPVVPAADVPRQQAALAKQWPYEDLLWALLNTKEFLFNH